MGAESKTFYIFHDNSLVHLKFQTTQKLEDVRTGVNDALICLEKMPLADDDLFSVRSMNGQLLEPEDLLDLDGTEYFLDTGDQSWKYAQIIHSKMYGAPSDHEDAEVQDEQEDITENPQQEQDEVESSPQNSKSPTSPQPPESPAQSAQAQDSIRLVEPAVVALEAQEQLVDIPPEVQSESMKKLESQLISTKGLSFQKIARNGTVSQRHIRSNNNFNQFTIDGGKKLVFTPSEFDSAVPGKVSTELKKKKGIPDKSCVCVKLKNRYISMQFANPDAAAAFCMNFPKLMNQH